MRRLTAKTRIAIGLACMLVSVLCTAMMIGIVPERESAILAGRATTCEMIAVTGSDYISRGELRRLEYVLQSVVERNDKILTAGVRRSDGELIAAAGDHVTLWESRSSGRSTETHVHVPIRSGQEKWGDVELRYRQLGKSGIAGYIESPWLRLTVFVTGSSYVLFLIYLRQMLAHLDPSKTVPRRVRSALDSLAEGLLVIDKDQRIVLANQSFSTWVGRDAEKLVGVHAAKLGWVKDEQGSPIDTYPWVEAIRLESPQAGVMLGMKRKDEPNRVLMANASPVLGHEGKYRGVLVSFDDVTQLEETKKDLHVAMRAAEDANQAKGAFLARMSHEIRTPMNAILGYTDVLRRGFDENFENRQEYLNTIHGSGEHLLALINDILDLSKVESGQMELETERCSPHKLISQVVTLLRSKADEKGIALEFRCNGLLPETILTDEVRLRQAIMNLAGNAIKFTEKGGVTIVARLVGQPFVPKDGQDACVKPQMAIDVIDTGIGIPKAAQDKIFEPFAQADTSVTRRFGGTGLGLAISKQLAEAMGGGVEITSEKGEGSTFTVTVDVGALDGIKMVDSKTAQAAVTQAVSESKQILQLPPARILVADDGESNRKLIELVLTRAGVEVVLVENGQLAVDRAIDAPFDVILMDMQMPLMDGYTATMTLREAGYELPIIALTAHAMRGDEEKCRAAGCSGFLTKPIKIDILLATLSEVLEEGGRQTPHDESCTVGPISQSVRNDSEDRNDTYDGPSPSMDDDERPSDGTKDECRQYEQTLTEIADVSREVMRFEHRSSREDSALTSDGSLTTSATATNVNPIRCGFPLDDPDFLEIAQEFVGRLDEMLAAVHEACSNQDDGEIANFAHWLKGSGGTAGFDDFTDPAYQLELAAKSQERDRYESLIGKIVEMANRIELPTSAQDPPTHSGLSDSNVTPDQNQPTNVGHDTPLLSSLPTADADFREIVEEFVGRLTGKLEAMEQAWLARDYDELASLAHWLKGSGGTAGFDAFTSPAKVLERLIEEQNEELIPAAIDELRRFARQIVIPTPV